MEERCRKRVKFISELVKNICVLGEIMKKKLIKDSNKITILALSWRDIKSPSSGGAEVHTHEMLSRVDNNKFRILHFSPLYQNMKLYECIDGVHYVRKGNVLSVILFAWLFYIKNRKKIDFVIDQCNTHRFFTPFWVNRKKRVFYIHQLTREIWDINLKFPLSKIGRCMETPLLKIYKNDFAITVSESTRKDLVAVGFDESKIFIVPNGVNFVPWKPEEFLEKEKIPTFIYVGRYASYKGIDDAIDALGKLKETGCSAKLWILGKRNETYIDNNLQPISEKYGLSWGDKNKDGDIITWGFVSEQEKLELISRATAVVFPSIREGWGIPITEAGNVGTPSIVYDSPGIRDAVDFGKAGYLCKSNDSNGLLEQMFLAVNDKLVYNNKISAAYCFSKQFQWNKIGEIFETIINTIRV